MDLRLIRDATLRLAPGVDFLIDPMLGVVRLVPSAIVIAVHLEAVAHSLVTRTALQAAADDAGIAPTRLRIPADGDSITLAAVPNRDAA